MALPNQGKAPRKGLGVPALRAVSQSRDDERLTAGILAGSRVHYDLLYDASFHRIYRYALERLGAPGPARALTEQVLRTVFQELPRWPGRPSLLEWIYGITRAVHDQRAVPDPTMPCERASDVGSLHVGGS